MASAYTTKRGKNKKGKLGQRKDASNNAANKLSQKMFADQPLEFLSAADFAPKTLGNSATRRRAEALESARASLNLLLTGSCGNSECKKTKEAGKQLLICTACKSKAYCDVECQKADWKSHKAACKEIKEKKEAEKNGTTVAVLDKKEGSTASAASTASSTTASSSSAPAAASSTTSAPATATTVDEEDGDDEEEEEDEEVEVDAKKEVDANGLD